MSKGKPRAQSIADEATIKAATRQKPSKKSAADANFGISIVVPDPADLVLNGLNPVAPEAGFPGRAVLFPPGSVPGVDPDQYTFVAYVSQSIAQGEQPTSIFFPSNVDGLLFADLPNGPLTPPGASSLFAALASAIQNQVGPPPPDGTGNDHG
jgi:hypothetical protein